MNRSVQINIHGDNTGNVAAGSGIVQVGSQDVLRPAMVPEAAEPATTRVRLLEALTSQFSEDELRTLIFMMNIDADSLPHDTKTELARELIGYCERHNRLEQLATAIDRLTASF